MNTAAPITADEHGVVLLLVPAPSARPVPADAVARSFASAIAGRCEQASASAARLVAGSGGEVLLRSGAMFVAGWRSAESARVDGRSAADARAVLDALGKELESEVPFLRAALGAGTIVPIELGDRTIGRLDLVAGSAVQDAVQALQRSPDRLIATSPRVGAAAVSHAFEASATAAAPAMAGAFPETFSWGELVRRVTIGIVHLDQRLDRIAASREPVDRTVAMIQRECARAGGMVLATLPIATAPALLCVFGLDGTTTGESSVSAVEAAIRIRRNAPREGLGVRIALTTGPVSWRSSPADAPLLAGDPILRAIWLASSDLGAIVCDATTRAATVDLFQILALDNLDRASGPVTFVVAGSSTAGQKPGCRGTGTFVGRHAELAWVGSRLAVERSGPSAMWIRGEAGIGKSALLEQLVADAESSGREVLRCAGDPIAPDSPFAAWKDLVRRELQTDAIVPIEMSGAFSDFMARLGHEEDLAPLLAAVADLPLAESTRSASLSQAARGALIEDLLVSVLAGVAARGRPLVVIDDAHWVDDSSLQVVLRALDTEVQVDFLLMSRPASRGGAWTRLQAKPLVAALELGELDASSGVMLAASLAGGHSVADAAAEWIAANAGGNPLFVRELLRDALRRGRLRVVSGRIESVPVPAADESLSSLEALVERQVAALDEVARTTLCCASVLGAPIDREDLVSLLPDSVPGDRLEACIDTLIDEGLLELAGVGLRFHHELIRLAAYGMLPDPLRRTLHRRMAERLGAARDEMSTRRDLLLAHHWDGAGCPDRASRHYAAAAWRALCDGGGAEGVALYTLALECDDKAGSSRVKSLERAGWESNLAGAHWSIGDMRRAQDYSRRALELAGDEYPSTTAAYNRRMLRDAWRVARWWRGRHADPSEAEQTRLLVCMGAARRLADSQYFLGDSSALLCACLAATAHALNSKNLVPAARAAGLVAYTAGLVGLTHFSDRLFARTLREAEAAGDLGAVTGIIGAETMMRVGQADWARALPLAERAIELCRRGTDSHDIGAALTLIGLSQYYRGCFDMAAASFVELRELAVARRRDQHRAWAEFMQGQTLLPRGEARLALERLKESRELLEHSSDVISLTICRAVESAAHVRLGNFDAAAVAALEAARLGRPTPPRNFSSLEGYAGPVDTFLALAHECGAGSAERRRWLTEASQSMRPLAAYARLFPVGAARLRMARGWLAWLDGHPRRARKAWTDALKQARKRSSGYDEVRISRSFELTRLASPPDPSILPDEEIGRLSPHPIVI